MSYSLRSHGLQHARLLCPSLPPRVCSDSCPLSQWCTTQPPRPLSSPSPPAPNPSQHQGLFQWVGSLHQVAKVLELQLQWDLGLISFKTDWFDFLAVEGTLKSLLQHHSLKESILGAQSLWSNSHIHTWLLERPYPWLYKVSSAKWYLCLLRTIF